MELYFLNRKYPYVFLSQQMEMKEAMYNYNHAQKICSSGPHLPCPPIVVADD